MPVDVNKEVRALHDEIVQCRRWLHAHGERSWKEFQTTKFLVEKLREFGMEPHTYAERTGCWALIKGGKAGPGAKTILLRADIDAMPADDPKDVPYRNTLPEAVHSCGHDSHTTMVLYAGRILNAVRQELTGNVKLVFEAGEELGEGGNFCVSQGLVDDVDAAFAIHVWGELGQGLVNIGSGTRTAAFNRLKIVLHGHGTHTGAPEDSRDTIMAAAKVIENLQLIETRYKSPFETVIVAIGKIYGGSAPNTYCDTLTMEGTIRTYSMAFMDRMDEEVARIVKGTAALLGCTADIEIYRGHPPVVHDPEMVEISRRAVRNLFGEEALANDFPPMGASDTFSSYSTHVPGIFALLGTKNLEKGFDKTVHNDYYDMDDDAVVPRGTAIFAQVVLEYFKAQQAK